MHVVGVYQKGVTVSLYVNGALVNELVFKMRTFSQVLEEPTQSSLGSYHSKH